VESKSSELKDYTNMITLTVKTSKEASTTAGALFQKHDPRIVRINEFSVEIVPEGTCWRYTTMINGRYRQPGTTLGKNKVNISRLHLSLDTETKRAMVVLNTDTAATEDILDKMRKLPHVISIKPIKCKDGSYGKCCSSGHTMGDEGKGKLVDLYTEGADVIARFQGGNNAAIHL